MASNAYGNRIIAGPDGNPLDPPTVDLEVTVTVRLKIKAATIDADGDVRVDMRQELADQIGTTLEHELGYGDGGESTDLVQEVIFVEVDLTD